MSICNFTPGSIGASCFNGTTASMLTRQARLRLLRTHSGTDTWLDASVTAGGVWWTGWKPASKCLRTGYDSAGGSFQGMNYWASESRSLADGVPGTAGDLWRGILNSGDYGRNGRTFGLSTTVSGKYQCWVPGNSVGQLWLQQAMGWSQGMYRTCYRTYVCGAVTKEGCYDWSASYHQDWVLDGVGNAQFGCCAGEDKVQC
ncbi:hypothetical protein BJ742DRAFT_865076 [Cladochytrium replicatum]|nr:hypothetical protein BJ742DRAFT_865076 [Cladochytrium replicatum]